MKLRTLGALRLEGASLTRPKPLLKLAYLALNGPTTRRELADVFFRDADDPRDSLSTSLRHLRKAEVVDLLPDDRIASRVPCDATDLLADFDAYRYEAVLKAYEGPFLDGLDVGLGLDLEDWLFATREAIARRVRSAALHRARAALAEGRLEDARQLALHAVSLRDAPELELDELASALPVLEKLGMPEAAQLRELADGYGLDLERPRVERRARPRTAVAEVPQRNTPFFGRESELRALDDLLRDPTQRLVTLFGLGGVGKTRLAARLAERLTAHQPERFRDGVVVVPLESVPQPSAVVAAIAARLALPSAAGASSAALADALASWHVLLVLDNFEHVLPAVDDLAVLLRAAPHVRLLVTSRARLGLAEERTVELSGLATTRDGASPSDAARLFLERAERVGFPLEAAARDLEAIEALCRDLEGYPLGIELAASMTRVLGVVDIRRSLGETLDVLDHGPVDVPERHRAVRSAFEPTWNLLGDRERDVLLRLSVFRSGFQFDAAAAVAGVSLPLLLRLVDQALVRSDGSGRGRFGFHPLLRAYLRERTDEAVAEEAGAAHRRFFATYLKAAARRVAAEPHEVLDRLELDLPDVVHAIEAALETGGATVGVEMAHALIVEVDFLQARDVGVDLVALARRTAELAEDAGSWGTAERLWTKVANAVRVRQYDVDEAVRAYERALGLAERAQDVGRQVMLRAILGALLDSMDREGAEDHFEVATALATESGDAALQCEVVQRWAYVSTMRGDWSRSAERYARAVELAERLVARREGGGRAPNLLFFSLLGLAGAVGEQGDVAGSIPIRLRALAVAIERGQQLWQAYAHYELAFAHDDLGSLDDSATHAREALQRFEAHGAEADRAEVALFLKEVERKAAHHAEITPAPSQ